MDDKKIFSKEKFIAAIHVLGATLEDDFDLIKKKYRKLAMQFHPDREDGNEDKFKEIQTSYDYISHWYDKIDIKNLNDKNKTYYYDKDYDYDENEKYYYENKYRDMGEKFSFKYKDKGTIQEIADLFFKSFVDNCKKVTNENRNNQIKQLVEGFVTFTKTYEIKVISLGVIQLSYLNAVWNSQDVKIIGICNDVFEKLQNNYGNNTTTEIMNPNIGYLKPAFCNNGFFLIDSILATTSVPDDSFISIFKTKNSIEDFEEKKYYSMVHEDKLFINRLLNHNKNAEILEKLAKHKLLDFSNKIYAENDINPYNEVLLANINLGDNVKSIFLKDKGINWIVEMISKEDLPTKKNEVYKNIALCFEKEIISNGLGQKIPEKYQSKQISIISKSKKIYESINGSLKPGLTSFWEITKKIIKQSEEELLINAVFEALNDKNILKITETLNNIKNKGFDFQNIKRKDIPIAVYLVWDAMYNKDDEIFTSKVMDIFKKDYPALLNVKDTFGNTANDWLNKVNIKIDKNKYKL